MSRDENTFEQNLAELERLVKELEIGDLDLDKSLEIYEKAIVLRERCRKFLNESEKKVRKLMETAEGIREEEFNV